MKWFLGPLSSKLVSFLSISWRWLNTAAMSFLLIAFYAPLVQTLYERILPEHGGFVDERFGQKRPFIPQGASHAHGAIV
jgi:hypothetical protein